MENNDKERLEVLESIIDRLEKKLDDIGLQMERMKLAEYVSYLEHPKRLIWSNFVSGVAKGFGTLVGLTVVAALAVYILKFLLTLNLPLISSYIAELIVLIQKELGRGGLKGCE